MMSRLAAIALLVTAGGAATLVACSSSSTDRYPIISGPRDWATDPAVALVDAPTDLYAISDVHGGYARMATLLAAANVIDAVPSAPSAMTWSAGSAVLVLAGDLFDKGPQGLEVIDAMRALETSAGDAGGAVVVLLGNHETEFFADPTNSKADGSDGIDQELAADDLLPANIANGSDPHGAWLRQRPLAARVGAWMFSHAGNTQGLTVAALETTLEAAIDANDYADPAIAGSDSIVEADDWYTSDDTIGARYASAAGAAHLVFGHDPHALGPAGTIAMGQHATLFRIDCGMSPDVDYSAGAVLHVHHDGGSDTAESIDASGAATSLWP